MLKFMRIGILVYHHLIGTVAIKLIVDFEMFLLKGQKTSIRRV